ncbi:MAG: hypothetical protein ACKOF9_09060 [Burkholderiales bacterium]
MQATAGKITRSVEAEVSTAVAKVDQPMFGNGGAASVTRRQYIKANVAESAYANQKSGFGEHVKVERALRQEAPSSALPESYMNQKHSVNMEQARGLPDSTLNAFGEVRNAQYFWQQLRAREPAMFDKSNIYKMDELGLSPTVNKTWIDHNPAHKAFKGDTLHHHHVDHGPIAVPLPKTIHERWTTALHPKRK